MSDSDFSHQVTSEILPLKDIFNSIFFVSVGLLLNINFVVGSLALIILVVFSVILFKSLLVFIIIRILKFPVRTAVLTGLALAQVGEFSFVLAQEGMTYHLLESSLYNIFLASSIFTMLLTPLILQLAPILANKAVNIAPISADINSFIHLDEILAAGLTSTYFINEDNYHNGKTLEQLNLRAKTEATIIAIVRGNKTISNPSAKDTIESNDTLVITGTHKSVDLAFSLLDGKV